MILSEGTVAPYRYARGRAPLLVSMPHAGTFIPHSIGCALTQAAARRPDTDWHLPRLYAFLDAIGASVIVANFSRYVIDVNRPPGGENLYPGRETPLLCPTDTFAREPLYRGAPPSEGEVRRRLETVWNRYHARLASELARIRDEHGAALLWDAHSIVSECPRLFDGALPDFNFGTGGGAACDPRISETLLRIVKDDGDYTAVLDGRFQGGYITRHHGRPGANIHAIQLELSQRVYMDETPPYTFRAERARFVQPLLRKLLEAALTLLPRQPPPAASR